MLCLPNVQLCCHHVLLQLPPDPVLSLSLSSPPATATGATCIVYCVLIFALHRLTFFRGKVFKIWLSGRRPNTAVERLVYSTYANPIVNTLDTVLAALLRWLRQKSGGQGAWNRFFFKLHFEFTLWSLGCQNLFDQTKPSIRSKISQQYSTECKNSNIHSWAIRNQLHQITPAEVVLVSYFTLTFPSWCLILSRIRTSRLNFSLTDQSHWWAAKTRRTGCDMSMH